MSLRAQILRSLLRPAGAAAALLVLAACAGGQAPTLGQPVSAASAYEAGKAHFAAGRLGLALESFQDARRRDPMSVAAHNGVGAVYDRMGRHVLAEQAYLEALALAPQDPLTLNNIGWSRHLRGQSEVAAFYLARAMELAPENPVVLANADRVGSRLSSAPARVPVASIDLREAALRPRIVRQSAGEQLLVTAASPRVAPLADLPGLTDEGDVLEFRGAPAQDAAPPVPPPEQGRTDAAGQGEGAAWEAAAPPPAPSAPRTAERVRLTGVEVSNGTGRRLMATRVAAWLAQRDVAVARRTNASRFSHDRSVILYSPAGGRPAAEALAALLPGPVDVRPAGDGQTSPLRLVLGADLLEFDLQLLATHRSRDNDPSHAVS